ncbi:MAG: hypothetical protein RIT19_1059 [Verrucomicrobiota bacterium]
MSPSVPEFVPPGSAPWCLFAGLALAGRTADLVSTWIATPNLALEGNPLARRLGWRWGIPINGLASLGIGCLPGLAIAVATTSALVAARNFQNAWIMRSMGEWSYRLWMSERIDEAPRALPALSFIAEAGLTLVPGLALVLFTEPGGVAPSVGLGICAYSAAVALFTLMALWRRRG